MTRICIVLPRNMYFGPARATSIDLCAHDFVLHSRHLNDTVVIGERIADPFDDVRYVGLPPCKGRAMLADFVAAVEGLNPDLVVVHQHGPTAGRIADALHGVPVLLHRHSLKGGGIVRRMKNRYRFRNIAGIIFVSEIAARAFTGPQNMHVVHNAIETVRHFSAEPKEKTVFFAGRLAPNKGIVELAEALATVLPDYPGWNAEFALLINPDTSRQLADRVWASLKPLAGQTTVFENLTHDRVMDRFARCEISVTPSTSGEAFGRTALEAMAGGAAVIVSRQGGLPEVVGDAGLIVERANPEALVDALHRLMDSTDLRRDYQARARQRAVDMFDIRRAAHTLDAIYDSYLQRQNVSTASGGHATIPEKSRRDIDSISD